MARLRLCVSFLFWIYGLLFFDVPKVGVRGGEQRPHRGIPRTDAEAVIREIRHRKHIDAAELAHCRCTRAHGCDLTGEPPELAHNNPRLVHGPVCSVHAVVRQRRHDRRKQLIARNRHARVRQHRKRRSRQKLRPQRRILELANVHDSRRPRGGHDCVVSHRTRHDRSTATHHIAAHILIRCRRPRRRRPRRASCLSASIRPSQSRSSLSRDRARRSVTTAIARRHRPRPSHRRAQSHHRHHHHEFALRQVPCVAAIAVGRR